MKMGKYAAMEVGPASSVDECWQLVNTCEETGVPCMLLENYCYFRYNMAVLTMVRQGLFGELIHCKCGYGHDLRERIVLGKGTGPTPKGEGDYRSMHNERRNGELYPTHGIGPMAQCLNIQRGNRFTYLTSMASKASGLDIWSRENLPADHNRRNIEWMQGDIVTTNLKCQNGETVVMTFDTRLPRPTSFMYQVQGTKGMWLQDGDSSSADKSVVYLDGISPKHEWESFDPYQEKYEHPLWKKYLTGEVSGGHGGTDFLELRDFVECIKRQTNTPIDVYDAAAWMAIAPLSEASIATGSSPMAFPDFTDGKWMTAKPKFGLIDAC
jgi:predicted dehydrogenase